MKKSNLTQVISALELGLPIKMKDGHLYRMIEGELYVTMLVIEGGDRIVKYFESGLSFSNFVTLCDKLDEFDMMNIAWMSIKAKEYIEKYGPPENGMFENTQLDQEFEKEVIV